MKEECDIIHHYWLHNKCNLWCLGYKNIHIAICMSLTNPLKGLSFCPKSTVYGHNKCYLVQCSNDCTNNISVLELKFLNASSKCKKCRWPEWILTVALCCWKQPEEGCLITKNTSETHIFTRLQSLKIKCTNAFSEKPAWKAHVIFWLWAA